MKALGKPILTLIIGCLLLVVGNSIGQGSATSFLWVWIICGIPYGLPRIRLWFSMSNGDLGTSMAIFLLNFALAGLIGGFIYVWTMGKAVVAIIVICLNRGKDGLVEE